MSCADAATYFPPDDDFIRRAETLGVSQAVWDRAEYAAMSFPHAYRFTSYYRISSDKPGSQVPPETWQPGAPLELADMQSGLDIPTPEFMSWDPLMTHAQNWNGKNDAGLHGVMAYIQLIDKRKYAPGEVYQYQDPNSEVLGMVVEKATGENLADYLEEKLWHRIGAEQDALKQNLPGS